MHIVEQNVPLANRVGHARSIAVPKHSNFGPPRSTPSATTKERILRSVTVGRQGCNRLGSSSSTNIPMHKNAVRVCPRGAADSKNDGRPARKNLTS
jgi:hypothetical protein